MCRYFERFFLLSEEVPRLSWGKIKEFVVLEKKKLDGTYLYENSCFELCLMGSVSITIQMKNEKLLKNYLRLAEQTPVFKISL